MRSCDASHDRPAAPEADLWAAARRHRLSLPNTRFIAVTGSCGKTTTKDLIATVLAARYPGRKSDDTFNCGVDVVRSVLAVRPDDRFLVQELGAWGSGTLDQGIDLVRPDIAVVTNLRNDHYSRFRGPHGAQAEKGKLVASLPATGTAVLNWDDPLVRDLATRTLAAVVSFGRSSQAQLRAWDVRSTWPEPLSFCVDDGGRTTRVRTQLHGEHLLGSALAALAVGLRLGMDLDAVAAALETAPPTFRRMTPVVLADGVAFMRDDYKAPADSLPEVLTFLRNARATRRLAVIGWIADFPGRSRRMYTQIAREALEVLDAVIFVGQRATELWGVQHSTARDDQRAFRQRFFSSGSDATDRSDAARSTAGDIFVFTTVEEADQFLRDYLTAGDLVLLKGSGPVDHLERLLLSRQAPVACWALNCRRTHPCDVCALLRAPEIASVPGEPWMAAEDRP